MIQEGLLCTLRFPMPRDDEPGWTRYKIETVPGTGWTHLSDPSSVASAPWQYHISLCSGTEIYTYCQGDDDLIRAEWEELKGLSKAVHGRVVRLEVEDVQSNWVACIAPTSPILRDHITHIRRCRDMGDLHLHSPFTISM
jgi:hypothetical protein